MTLSDATDAAGATEQNRRARVVILGEFSAGKSTLINLFTGGANLRTQVTATQMPPVWISHPTDPDSISVADTLYIRTFIQAPLLETFDLIDTPGNSDPNISSIAWERAAELADIAIWCSSSTQAWRQSELSAWKEVPENVRARSILLLTRADKLTSDADREKVLNRVKREASDHFTHIHMASLLELDNTRDVLADLIAMVEPTGSLSAQTAAIAAATESNASTATDDSNQSQQPAVDTEMTDDMLIDSLDLTGDTSLDELGLNDEDDADMDEVLAALTGAAPVAVAATAVKAASKSEKAPAKPADAELEMTETPEGLRESPTETLVEDEPYAAEGYASELWRAMSSTVSHDDPDAYEAVFDSFLEKLDTEIAMLRGQLNMKAAG